MGWWADWMDRLDGEGIRRAVEFAESRASDPDPFVYASGQTLETRDLAQIVDGIIASQSGVTPQHIANLPAVAGARRLIASTIDQLPFVVDGDMPEWFRRPETLNQSDWGSFDWGDIIQHTVDSMIVHGRAFWRCRRVGGSWRIDPLQPGAVQIFPANDGTIGRQFVLTGRSRWTPEVPATGTPEQRDYLLHIPYLVTTDEPAGTTPLRLAMSTLAGYVTTERHVASMFDEGTHTGGVLSTAHDITVTQASQWQDAWITARKTKRIPVLGNGLEYHNEAPNARDLQLVEARMFNQSAVWALLGIPQAYMGSSLMGGQSSLAYANAQDNRRQFADNCLRAFTTQIEDAVSRLLPPGRGTGEAVNARFDYTEWEGRVDSGDAPVAAPADQAV